MNWENFNIKFKLQNEGEQFWVNHRTEKVLNCGFEEGELDFSCKYSFRAETPLHLRAKAQIGDEIRVHMLPYRIELYVNGKLTDEEWPCGNHYLKDCMLTDNGCELKLESAEEFGENTKPEEFGENTKPEEFGENTKPEDGGDFGENIKPEDAGNFGDNTKPEDAGNSGEHTKSEDGGAFGENKKPEDAGNFGDNTKPENAGNFEKDTYIESTVCGTFQNAEGWQPEENVFVGDCMPYSHEGTYHVLYLKDRHRHQSKWGLGAHQWSHISTDDFVNWQIHPMAVEIDDPWEGSICTGSWIYDGSAHYLFYTVRMCDGSPARICRSVSRDGYHFEKDRDFSFTLSEKYTAPSARDPKILKDAQGLYHMILTTSLSESRRGCLAHLVSEDLKDWKELEEPLYIAPAEMGEPECPDYFCKDGYYYLVYSLRGKGYYQYSREPFSGWQMPDEPIIPCKSVPKAATWNDRLIFAGFDGQGKYAGTLTFLEAVVKEDGQLEYNKVEV